MSAVATAEKQSPNGNQSLQDNAAVLDTPEKESGVEQSPEQETANNQSANVEGLAPNPVVDFSMAGNASAAPVSASADRAVPMNGVSAATPAVSSNNTTTENAEQETKDGEAGGKAASAGPVSGAGDSGAEDTNTSGDPGGAGGGASTGASGGADDGGEGATVPESEDGKGVAKEEQKPEGEAAEGDAADKSGKASGSSVLDFQASGKAMDKQNAVPAVSDPNKDSAFQGVLSHTETAMEEQNTHLPAETKMAETTAATPLSDAEQDQKNDQLGHLGTMNQIAESEDQKKEPFTPEKFKALLQGHLTELSKKMPTDEDSAEEFKDEKPIEAVKESIASDVKSENEKLSGPMAQQAEQPEPPASGVPATPNVAIPEEEVGPPPLSVDPISAVPKEKSASELSMEKESQSLDDAMEANEVTDEQLAISNEPKFLEAKQSKDDAQAQAAAAPSTFRAIEQKKLAEAQANAEKRSQKGLKDMHVARTGALGNVLTEQQTTGTSDQDKQKEIYKKLETIYTNTKDEVKKKLDGLSEKVDTIFSTKAEQAKSTFEDNVEDRLDDIYGVTVIDDWLFGEDTEAIEEAFRIEKGKFERTMNSVIDDLATIIADELNATIDIIKKGKKDSEDFFNTLDADQKKLAQDAFDNFNDQYDTLEETVYEKQDELAQDLASSYKENVDSLRESFDAIKESVSAGWIGAAFNFIAGVIDTILKIKDLLLNLLSAVVDAIGAILSDPIGFLSNLIDGIVQGFTNFKNNILNNIMTGLIEWLTGSLGGVGITIPDNLFSLSGIFDLVAQILGLTWDYFRNKAVKLLGEPVVQAMETGFEIFMIIKEKGIEGLWEYIKEQFNDLKEMVMDAIRDMIITKVIEAGVKWIMGLMSPAGAFVKAAMMIIDIAKFFIERAAQIIELVSAFVDGIRALANGDVSAVAKAVEKALVKAIPILIGFLASLVGITGLTAKVQKIIKRVRKRIDKAIDKLIKKGKKAFGKLIGKGKGSDKKKLDKNAEEKQDSNKDTEADGTVSVPIRLNGKPHTLLAVTKGGKDSLEMKSRQESIEDRVARINRQLDAYIADPNVPDSFKDIFREMKQGPITQLDRVEEEATAKFRELKKTKKGKKLKKDSFIKKEKSKVLNTIVAKIEEICRRPGMENVQDFSPLAIERADIANSKLGTEFTEKQEAVQKVFTDMKEDILSAIPPGSKVKYRGSLATGIKGPHKTVNDAIQFFDPKKFDADVFIEVTNEVWAHAGTQVPKARTEGKLKLQEMVAWDYYSQLISLTDAIKEKLKDITGYKLKGGEADFELMIQSVRKSENQLRSGIQYEPNSFANAGYPEIEKRLVKERDKDGNDKIISPENHVEINL